MNNKNEENGHFEIGTIEYDNFYTSNGKFFIKDQIENAVKEAEKHLKQLIDNTTYRKFKKYVSKYHLKIRYGNYLPKISTTDSEESAIYSDILRKLNVNLIKGYDLLNFYNIQNVKFGEHGVYENLDEKHKMAETSDGKINISNPTNLPCDFNNDLDIHGKANSNLNANYFYPICNNEIFYTDEIFNSFVIHEEKEFFILYSKDFKLNILFKDIIYNENKNLNHSSKEKLQNANLHARNDKLENIQTSTNKIQNKRKFPTTFQIKPVRIEKHDKFSKRILKAKNSQVNENNSTEMGEKHQVDYETNHSDEKQKFKSSNRFSVVNFDLIEKNTLYTFKIIYENDFIRFCTLYLFNNPNCVGFICKGKIVKEKITQNQKIKKIINFVNNMNTEKSARKKYTKLELYEVVKSNKECKFLEQEYTYNFLFENKIYPLIPIRNYDNNETIMALAIKSFSKKDNSLVFREILHNKKYFSAKYFAEIEKSKNLKNQNYSGNCAEKSQKQHYLADDSDESTISMDIFHDESFKKDRAYLLECNSKKENNTITSNCKKNVSNMNDNSKIHNTETKKLGLTEKIAASKFFSKVPKSYYNKKYIKDETENFKNQNKKSVDDENTINYEYDNDNIENKDYGNSGNEKLVSVSNQSKSHITQCKPKFLLNLAKIYLSKKEELKVQEKDKDIVSTQNTEKMFLALVISEFPTCFMCKTAYSKGILLKSNSKGLIKVNDVIKVRILFENNFKLILTQEEKLFDEVSHSNKIKKFCSHFDHLNHLKRFNNYFKRASKYLPNPYRYQLLSTNEEQIDLSNFYPSDTNLFTYKRKKMN
ncbi:hypothetical protein EDEG_05092 [Edhazardia aedis USNM 41457]|uniref:Uncharacterized protein n=1 Tax=Edhazardia aedis (strain USNM 41457) TaxID=1003232 RepID=A0A0L1P649_EDHAE|nr:hypothetical protein EDEG_05092 [Edhazardia aedis USNM 41457]|eukprot:KNH48525.1 hypothetical protein EDEG_05092 [Edhazardia aedis USNM 41457]